MEKTSKQTVVVRSDFLRFPKILYSTLRQDSESNELCFLQRTETTWRSASLVATHREPSVI
jgi:hypothetical protein